MATLFSVEVHEDKKVTGYLAVDSLVNGRCYGGLRISSDISTDSLIQAARTMTLKYAFVGLPFGGAKAGIVADPEMPLADKRELLRIFGHALRPILQTRTYIPGCDLGVTDDDLKFMLVSNGIRELPRSLGQNTGFYAGVTVFTAATTAAKHIGLDPNHTSVAIEGFGSVGGSAAEAFWRTGSKVIAVSTSRGAIYNKRGLDIGELLNLSGQMGSDVVNHFPKAERIDKSELAALLVDIFCPCAQSHSITQRNAGLVSAKIISPGANAHTTPNAEQTLFKKGILSLPDFVANCGGVMAASMKRSGLSYDFVQRFIEQKYVQKVNDMIKAAENESMPIKEYAEKITEEKFHRLKKAAEKKSISSKIFNFALDLYRNGIIPYQLVTPIAPRYFEERFK
ncbi:MAG: Glu/Leu/Phe/Val dehydrogenase [Chloroflexota bacterium]|nr:MAG: Glu/Leu/Phe/Val dehydrogenase [Chloroflexota bacterium]